MARFTVSLQLQLVALAVCVLLSPAAALNFYAPSIRGQPLDWCLSPSRKADCGLPAANEFCKAAGYDRATFFKGPTPADKATRAIKTGETCAGQDCKTFTMVYCIREKFFPDPTINGKPLDWCLEGNKGCGKAAANYFCTNVGALTGSGEFYSHGAWTYGGPYNPSADTYQPKTKRTCKGSTGKCRTFSSISCEK